MESLCPIQLAVVVVAVITAAATDLWSFRVPNILTLPLILSGLLFHLVSESLALSMLGTIIGVAPLLFIYVYGGMGAGDLKMVAGLGAWLGPWYVIHVLIVAGIATGIYAAAIVVWCWVRKAAVPKRQLESGCLPQLQVQPMSHIAAVVRSAEARRLAVPFAAMLALGVVGTILWIGI